MKHPNERPLLFEANRFEHRFPLRMMPRSIENGTLAFAASQTNPEQDERRLIILSDQRSHMLEIIPMTPEYVTLDPAVARHHPRIFRRTLEHPRQDLFPIRAEY